MTVADMHDMVKFLLDTTSGRFSTTRIDKALNMAVTEMLTDRVNNMKWKKPYSFESNQQLRNELQPITFEGYGMVVRNLADTYNTSKYPYLWTGSTALPSNCYMTLSLKVKIDGVVYISEPTSYDEQDTLTDNPYTKPNLLHNTKVYWLESFYGIKIIWGNDGVLGTGAGSTGGYLDYITNPGVISYATATNILITNIGFQQEVCTKAASILMATVSNFNKSQVLENEKNKQ